MELKDFIKETVIDIVTAVEEINDQLRDKRISVAKLDTKDSYAFERISDTRLDRFLVRNCDFDIAIIAKDNLSGKGKSTINVLAASMKADVEAGKENSNASRIKFSLPIAIPSEKQK